MRGSRQDKKTEKSKDVKNKQMREGVEGDDHLWAPLAMTEVISTRRDDMSYKRWRGGTTTCPAR